MIFKNRYQAGRVLAEHLQRLRGEHPIIIALPRGGLPIGHEVAAALDAPLDVVVSRKLGAPMQPEFGFGAIAPDARAIDKTSVGYLGLSEADIERIVAREMKELRRRETLFHGDAPPLNVKGRTVIVVDDGLATGVTARAAIASLRHRGPQKIVYAAPVCAPDSAQEMRAHADEVICVSSPAGFSAVGQWYEDFEQTTDEEALALLHQARERQAESERATRPAAQDEASPPGM